MRSRLERDSGYRYMNLRRLNALTSAASSSNHSPFFSLGIESPMPVRFHPRGSWSDDVDRGCFLGKLNGKLRSRRPAALDFPIL